MMEWAFCIRIGEQGSKQGRLFGLGLWCGDRRRQGRKQASKTLELGGFPNKKGTHSLQVSPEAKRLLVINSVRKV